MIRKLHATEIITFPMLLVKLKKVHEKIEASLGAYVEELVAFTF